MQCNIFSKAVYIVWYKDDWNIIIFGPKCTDLLRHVSSKTRSHPSPRPVFRGSVRCWGFSSSASDHSATPCWASFRSSPSRRMAGSSSVSKSVALMHLRGPGIATRSKEMQRTFESRSLERLEWMELMEDFHQQLAVISTKSTKSWTDRVHRLITGCSISKSSQTDCRVVWFCKWRKRSQENWDTLRMHLHTEPTAICSHGSSSMKLIWASGVAIRVLRVFSPKCGAAGWDHKTCHQRSSQRDRIAWLWEL